MSIKTILLSLKKVRVPIVLFVLFHAVNFSSCSKFSNTVWVHYKQTSCADPWYDLSRKMGTKPAIRQFLTNHHIRTFKVRISDQRMEDIQICNACSCTTGRTVEVEIAESDLRKALDEGFYLP